MPAEISKQEERQILDAVKTATDHVAAGLTPDAAVEKVARDLGFGPGKVQLIGQAYNTGRQLDQWRAGDPSILDKLAAFDLCDPQAVIAAMATTARDKAAAALVSAEYARPPRLLDSYYREKVAGVVFPAPPPPTSASPRWAGDDGVKAYGKIDRAKHAADEARRVAAFHHDQVRSKVADLVGYFKQAGVARLPFAAVEAAAVTYYGDAASRLLSAVYADGNFKEKRAAATLRPTATPVDHAAAPFSTIKAAIDAAAACHTARQTAAVATVKVAEATAALKSFPSAGSARPPADSGRDPAAAVFGPTKVAFGFGTEVAAIAAGDILAHRATHRAADDDPYGDAEDIDEDVKDARREMAALPPHLRHQLATHLVAKKAAAEKVGFLGAGMGAAFGAGFGRSVGGGIDRGMSNMAPQSPGEMVDDSWMHLEDPEHENELRKIRAHAMINQLMTDPDDPISGHDPDRVLNAYNEISAATPRLAENVATLRPALRRRLEGHQEPFEVKELLDIEHGLSRTKTPTPNTSIMSETPEKILG